MLSDYLFPPSPVACSLFFFSFLICWFQSIIQNENATLCVCFYFFSLFKFSNFSRNHFLTPFFWLACRQLRFLGGTRYNYHCACLVVIFFWYCFASPKFLNWILCHFVFLFFSHTHTVHGAKVSSWPSKRLSSPHSSYFTVPVPAKVNYSPNFSFHFSVTTLSLFILRLIIIVARK